MIINHPVALHVAIQNSQVRVIGRKLEEHCRNVDRLIAYNNRRIAKALRPLAFSSAMVQHGRDLLTAALDNGR